MKKLILVLGMLISYAALLCGCTSNDADDDVIKLRVSNWEEYIDEGDWDEEEIIELDDGTVLGENSIVDDFEEWFYEEYGKKVEVEYSTFGTNEDLYNQITLGDKFDLVCPSEYMIMKMMREGMLEPFSKSFYDPDLDNNYYVRNVSPFIMDKFNELAIDGQPISGYAAGYMWGTLGIVYNPEFVTEEEASHFDIMLNPKFNKCITIKDSVREAIFAGAAIKYYDIITAPEFVNSPDYAKKLSEYINATDEETVNDVEKILSDIQKNVYSFETDSGKADMVTGKVYANMQWSGDAVYTLDQAEEDDVMLCYIAPEEATNMWFDGWCMLKDAIDNDSEKKMAAEAFINFMAVPENAIRNMYYIGYTSVVSGGDSDLILQYIDYCYGAEEEDEDLVDYDLSYYFGRDASVCTTEEMVKRQFGAQYPTKEVTDRSVIMRCFDNEANERINRMWINVRCFDLDSLFR